MIRSCAPHPCPGWSRVLPQLGAGRLRTGLRDSRDRLIASDPGSDGFARDSGRCSRSARRCSSSPCTRRRWVRLPTLALLMGAIVAMLASTSVSEPSRTATLLTMGGVPARRLGGRGAGRRHLGAPPARPDDLRRGLLRGGVGAPVRATLVHLRVPGLAGLLLRVVPAPAAERPCRTCVGAIVVASVWVGAAAADGSARRPAGAAAADRPGACGPGRGPASRR